MKTNVADTSVMAFYGLTHKQTQTDRIYEFIEDRGSATIAMIARNLGMEKSTVSARVNAMVNGVYKDEKELQRPSLEFSWKGKCPVTGVTAKFWQVKTAIPQKVLIFDEVR